MLWRFAGVAIAPFPKLRSQYLQSSGHSMKAKHWVSPLFRNISWRAGVDPASGQQNLKPWLHHLRATIEKVTRVRLPGFYWTPGPLVEMLRNKLGLGQHTAFLTACRIEDLMRDYSRKLAGLSSWYDLPERRDEIRPPWRMPEIEKALTRW